jgi:CRP/FNR family transcriptional regulator, cyclic AMP receptor protein
MDGLAVEDVKCAALHRDDLMRILEDDHVVMGRLLARLAEMCRDRARLLSGMAFLDVTGRVAAKLMELAAVYGKADERGLRIDIKMSQRTLAGLVIASRQSVNRALATLITDGALIQESGTIVVREPELLRRRAELFHDDELDRVRAAYGPNLARLIEVKRRWDPDNVLRGNLNIKPS